jgi:hypothetical protein
MKIKILLISISLIVVPLITIAGQCTSQSDLGGTWGTGAKTVWVDTGGGPELAPLRYLLIIAGDTFFWYSYVQLNTEWELFAGTKGSYTYDGNIMIFKLTQAYDYGVGWSPSTETYAAQITISGNDLIYIEDRNEDEIYDDTIEFDDGVDMTDFSNDMKFIYSSKG